MNIEGLREVAAALRGKVPEHMPGLPKFEMQTWGMSTKTDSDGYILPPERPCQTVGCIAGWTCAVFEPTMWLDFTRFHGTGARIRRVARDALELNPFQERWLFEGRGFARNDDFGGVVDPPWHMITPELAAESIDYLIEAGEDYKKLKAGVLRHMLTDVG